jgi:GntR family transcriptional regulator/MocR family aminotransferase
MKRVSDSFLSPIAFDRSVTTPIYRQLYDWIRGAILDGRMRPGQRVPSTRALAVELKISRIPVLNAYEQLLAEGYLESFAGAGTSVARLIPDESLRPAAGKAGKEASANPEQRGPRRISQRGAALVQTPVESGLSILGAFRVSLPALDQFPLDLWSKLSVRHSRKLSVSAMGYGDAMGYLPFREAIAEYLGASRAVRCDPSQIMVTTGSQQALQICAHVLLDPGDRICMEEPGYPGARNAFVASGAKVVTAGVDEEGMDVPRFIRRKGSARVVYITPSHQYPTGMTMSAARRIALLQWAAEAGAWVIEDDYDSEYRFASRPVASLQGLDTAGRVIYIGTFSKVLFPALRLGYLVVPRDLVPAFAAAREASDIFSSTFYQLVMTDFIREGHFARHIRRMRMLYMERRTALVEAIQDEMPNLLEVIGAEAGMHLVALLPRRVDDVAVARAAAAVGISVVPLSACSAKPPVRGGLIFGYGGVNEDQIHAGILRLKTCFPSGSHSNGIRRK